MFKFLKRKSDPNSFFSHYSLHDKLGEGGYGRVLRCIHKKTGVVRAVKIVHDTKYRRKTWCENRQLNMPDEIVLWERSAHSSVVKLRDLYVEEEFWLSVMDYDPEFVDLSKLLATSGALTSESASDVIRQVIDVISHLRSVGVDHRDIKDENILYNPRTRLIKLIDFGSASPLKDGAYTKLQGTEGSIPPEIYLRGSYEWEGGVVWSVGCLAYSLIRGHVPYTTKEEVLSERELEWNYSEDSRAIHFVKQCLVYNVANRCSFSQITQHPWLLGK